MDVRMNIQGGGEEREDWLILVRSVHNNQVVSGGQKGKDEENQSELWESFL